MPLTRITLSEGDPANSAHVQIVTDGYLLVYEQDGALEITGRMGRTLVKSLLAGALQSALASKLGSIMKGRP